MLVVIKKKICTKKETRYLLLEIEKYFFNFLRFSCETEHKITLNPTGHLNLFILRTLILRILCY